MADTGEGECADVQSGGHDLFAARRDLDRTAGSAVVGNERESDQIRRLRERTGADHHGSGAHAVRRRWVVDACGWRQREYMEGCHSVDTRTRDREHGAVRESVRAQAALWNGVPILDCEQVRLVRGVALPLCVFAQRYEPDRDLCQRWRHCADRVKRERAAGLLHNRAGGCRHARAERLRNRSQDA